MQIFNFKKEIGEQTNELGKHKKKQNNEKEQAEMYACMNKEQQVPEYQQAAKPQWNTRRKNNVSIRHENISKFRLIPRPHSHQMTLWKHHWMNHLIQVQSKNQPST